MPIEHSAAGPTENPEFEAPAPSTETANRPGDGEAPWGPLHLAAFGGDLARLGALLAAGAAVDERAVPAGGCVGATPLHCAIAAGAAGAVERLIAAGADLRARDEAGYTPLLLAAELGDHASVKLLLRAGAEPCCELGDLSPLAAARRGRHQRVIGLLKQVCSIR